MGDKCGSRGKTAPMRLLGGVGLMCLLLGLGFASGCGSSSGSHALLGPFAITVDAAGTIYVTDLDPVTQTESRIVSMNDMNGSGWTTFGSPGSGVNQFQNLFGIAVDSAGRIRTADQGAGVTPRIALFDDMTGTNWTTFGTLGNGIDQFDAVDGIVVDAAGKIYVADLNQRIARIDYLSGISWLSYGSFGSGVGQFSNPIGVALDGDGKIYVVDSGNNRIVRMDDMAGTNWTSFGVGGAGAGQFDAPFGVAVDNAKKIYITDSKNGRVVRIDDMTGSGWTELDGFDYPMGIAIDTAGKVYVVDYGRRQIVRIDDISGAGKVTYP